MTNATLYAGIASRMTIGGGYGVPGHGFVGHKGRDLVARRGTPIYAAGTGTVTSLSRVTVDAYGYFVNVDYPTAFGIVRVLSGHLSMIDVSVGQKVTLATRLGLSGGDVGMPGAGRSTGPHLHESVFVNGVQKNPDDYLLPRAKLAAAGGITSTLTPVTESESPMYVLVNHTVGTASALHLMSETTDYVLDDPNDQAEWLSRLPVINEVGTSGLDNWHRAQEKNLAVIAKAVADALPKAATVTAAPIDYAALAKAVNDDAARRLAN